MQEVGMGVKGMGMGMGVMNGEYINNAHFTD